MSLYSEEIKPVIEKLKTERDEMKVQLNLAKMDLRDELKSDWDTLEHKWQNVATKKVEMENSMEDAAQTVKKELHRIIEDIKSGYGKIKEKLQ